MKDSISILLEEIVISSNVSNALEVGIDVNIARITQFKQVINVVFKRKDIIKVDGFLTSKTFCFFLNPHLVLKH